MKYQNTQLGFPFHIYSHCSCKQSRLYRQNDRSAWSECCITLYIGYAHINNSWHRYTYRGRYISCMHDQYAHCYILFVCYPGSYDSLRSIGLSFISIRFFFLNLPTRYSHFLFTFLLLHFLSSQHVAYVLFKDITNKCMYAMLGLYQKRYPDENCSNLVTLIFDLLTSFRYASPCLLNKLPASFRST